MSSVYPSSVDGREVTLTRQVHSHSGPRRVLVAEDHPIYRHMLGLVLEQFGIQATLVADGDEALRDWRHRHFDALLLDIEMPRMSGLATTKLIRSQEAGRSPTSIIIISADFRPERIAECLKAGADLHLAKPVTAAIVASALTSVLGEEFAAEARTTRLQQSTH